MTRHVVTSSDTHHRIACGRDWLKSRALAEEVLIIGATLGDGWDLTSAILARWVATLIEDRTQLLCPGSRRLE